MTTEDERKCNGCGIMHTFRVTDSWSGDFHCPVHDYCIACHNEQSEAVTNDGQEFLDKLANDFREMWLEECAKGMRNRPMTVMVTNKGYDEIEKRKNEGKPYQDLIFKYGKL